MTISLHVGDYATTMISSSKLMAWPGKKRGDLQPQEQQLWRDVNRRETVLLVPTRALSIVLTPIFLSAMVL